MNDSRKLDERLDEVLQTMRASDFRQDPEEVARMEQRNETPKAPALGDHMPTGWRQRVAEVRHATDEEMERAVAAADAEWRTNKARVLVARLPEVYREAVPRHADTTAWLEGYRKGNRHGFVILGHHGSGKTWEAMALARALLVEDRIPVQTATAPELLELLRPGGSGDIGQFKVAPVLVIDDLGAEKVTDWVDEQLYTIAGFRASRNLPMIITSNLEPDQIKKRYDARLVQRLFGGATLLDIKGKSIRPLPF
jgi:DNA replication protein DnaC